MHMINCICFMLYIILYVGGLSGPILMEPSTALVSEMYRLTNGEHPQCVLWTP